MHSFSYAIKKISHRIIWIGNSYSTGSIILFYLSPFSHHHSLWFNMLISGWPVLHQIILILYEFVIITWEPKCILTISTVSVAFCFGRCSKHTLSVSHFFKWVTNRRRGAMELWLGIGILWPVAAISLLCADVAGDMGATALLSKNSFQTNEHLSFNRIYLFKYLLFLQWKRYIFYIRLYSQIMLYNFTECRKTEDFYMKIVNCPTLE